MPDSPATTLVARALERLQKLADGNGVAPDAIKLIGAEEKTWVLNGTMKLDPLAEAIPGRTPEAAKAAKPVALGNFAALKTEVERRQKVFRDTPSWIPATIKQLKEQPGEGWGLDDVRIPLLEQTVLLSASEACPSCGGAKMLTCQQCGGQGSLTCNHCNGTRQEICYNCNGHGVHASNPNQPCVVCNGRRYIPCRFCQAAGVIICPTCHGQRGIVCSTCKGIGMMTQEITMTFGARTHFLIANNSDLPSGLRRGLDRVGIAGIVNGYADIESVTPPVAEDDDSLHEVPGMEAYAPTPKKEKPPSPEVHYVAHLPYADLRMSFNGKAVLVSSFGKRGALMGVPPFLDNALESWREKLRSATTGKGNMDDALGARVMRDALTLQLSGKTDMRELRKLYPLGLSNEAAQEIMTNMRLALNRHTLHVRAIVAVLCAVLSGGLFVGLFFTQLNVQLTQNLQTYAGMGVDLGLLMLACSLSWLALASVTSFALRKRFPDSKIPLTQKIGKTGYAMLGAIVAMFIVVVMLAKPAWLLITF
jgi:hypothetical protein